MAEVTHIPTKSGKVRILYDYEASLRQAVEENARAIEALEAVRDTLDYHRRHNRPLKALEWLRKLIP